MNEPIRVEMKIPPVFKALDDPYDYYVIKGGRGSAKSESVGRKLLLKGIESKRKIVCGREFQSSIKESVYDMLGDFVSTYHLEKFYTVLKTEIIGANGTTFSFTGLRHSINSIKSMYDVDDFWGEEAQTFSANTFKILLPTIRKPGSRLYFTMNPDLEEDPAYQTLVVNPPPNTLVLTVNHDQNPYFPERLRHLMEKDKAEDYDKYLNVWEGQCRQAIEGAIFARHLETAASEGRITDDVEYNPSVPVHTWWDLGKRNKTAIWVGQYVAMQWRMLHCIVGFGRDLEDYMSDLEALPYTYGTHYLPHDAQQDRMGMQRTVEDQVRARLGNVEIVPVVSHKINSIEAAKAIFPLVWFHKTNCADGLYHMRRYAYAISETGKVGAEPDHAHSDAPDAFQCFAMSAQPDLIDDDRPRYSSPSPRLG